MITTTATIPSNVIVGNPAAGTDGTVVAAGDGVFVAGAVGAVVVSGSCTTGAFVVTTNTENPGVSALNSTEPSAAGEEAVVGSSTHFPSVNLAKTISEVDVVPSSALVSVNVKVAFVTLAFRVADGLICNTFSGICEDDGKAVRACPLSSVVGICLRALI